MAEIQNPNQQGGGQDSRTILAFSTIFLLMFLGLQYFKQKNATPAPPTQQQQQAAKPSSIAAPPFAGAPAVNSGQGASVKAEAESETIVENELYRIRFSNRGGQVTSWILKKYTDDTGKPLDLVNREAAPQHGYPLSLYTYDAGLDKAALRSAL